MALATTTDFRDFTGLDLPDDRVQILLDIASGAVQAYCGWHIAPSVTETVTADGSGGVVLTLPTLHLTALLSLTENGDTVDVGDTEWSAVGLVTRTTAWTRSLRGITAEITHGYTECPSAIKGVVLMAVSRAAVSPTGAVRQQAGPFSITYSQTAPNQAGGVVLLEHEQRVLDRYSINNPP